MNVRSEPGGRYAGATVASVCGSWLLIPVAIHEEVLFRGLLIPYLNVYFQVQDDTLPSERMLNALLDLILRGIGA